MTGPGTLHPVLERRIGLFNRATLAAGWVATCVACSDVAAPLPGTAPGVSDGGGSGDGGSPEPRDAAPDSGSLEVGEPPGDASPPPGGVCAALAADSPIGAVGVALSDRRELVALRPDGTVQSLHRFFAGDPDVELIPYSPWLDPNHVMLLGRVRRCPSVTCGSRYELVIAGTDGVHVARGETPRDVSVMALLEDGRVVLRAPRELGRNSARLVDARLGTSVDLPDDLQIVGPATESGWLLGRLDDGTFLPKELVFLQIANRQIRRLPQEPRIGVDVDGRWFFVEIGDPPAPRLVTAGPASQRVIASLDPDVVRWSLQARGRDPTIVVAEGDFRPRVLFDVVSGAVFEVPDELLEVEGRGTWETGHGWFVFSDDGRPRWRVNVTEGVVEILDSSLLAPGDQLIDSVVCVPRPEPADADGRVAVGVRRVGATGLYFLDPEGASGPIGRPLHDIDGVSKTRHGETWMVRGIDGAETFCANRVPFEEAPPPDALVGPSIQIVAPDRPPIVLPPRTNVEIDRDGTCASWIETDDGGTRTTVVVDLQTGERLEVFEGASPVYLP